MTKDDSSVPKAVESRPLASWGPIFLEYLDLKAHLLAVERSLSFVFSRASSALSLGVERTDLRSGPNACQRAGLSSTSFHRRRSY
jgi:hypothetical protein